MIIKKPFIMYFTCLLVMATTAFTSAQEKKIYPQIILSSNKAINETASGIEISTGDELLIEIKTTNGGKAKNDTRIVTSLTFTIPGDADSFKFQNFNDQKAYVVISGCRCMDLGFNPVVKGAIEGKKSENGLWYITADVIATGKDSGEQKHFRYSGA